MAVFIIQIVVTFHGINEMDPKVSISRILFIILLTLSGSSYADYYLGASIESGGEFLASSTLGKTVDSGGGVKFEIGLHHSFNSASSIRLGVGYLLDEINATNGEASIDALTADAQYLWNISKYHHIGFGVTTHFQPEYKFYFTPDANSSDKAVSGNINFQTVVGSSIQYGYTLLTGFHVGIRYTKLMYKIENMSDTETGFADGGGFELNADGIGLFITTQF